MKKFIISLLMLLLPLAATAQRETGFFFGAGGGLNFGFDGLKYEDRPSSHNGAGFAGDFYAGGFLSETIGVRAGYQGFSISERYTEFGNNAYTYIHGDVLFRLHRNIIPYLHGGWMKIINPSWGGGIGILLPVHVGRNISIIPDIKAHFYPSSTFGMFENNLSITISATIGIAYHFWNSYYSQKNIYYQ